MNQRPESAHPRAAAWRHKLHPLMGIRASCGWTLILLLAGGSAAPARADLTVDGSSPNPTVINASFTGQITVNSGGVLEVDDGADISGGAVGVTVNGGTANIKGGSVSGGQGVVVNSGTANLDGGSVSDDGSESPSYGVTVNGGTANIDGASVSGSFQGVSVNGGTVNVQSGSISSAVDQGIGVSGGTVNINGGSVAGLIVVGGGANVHGGTISDPGVELLGGTVNIDGGVISGSIDGLLVDGFNGNSTANISGGSISGSQYGVDMEGGGAVSISGGSISGGQAGVVDSGGTVSIHGGCPLDLSLTTGQLTGYLLNGSYINTHTTGLVPGDLTTTCDSWSGVLQPVNADGSSVFKLGSTVPVKFQLTGASTGITNAHATFSYARIGDLGSGATVNETGSFDTPSAGNSFRYDPTAGQYIYNWSTKGLTTGIYQLGIDLGDGAGLHLVDVSLK